MDCLRRPQMPLIIATSMIFITSLACSLFSGVFPNTKYSPNTVTNLISAVNGGTITSSDGKLTLEIPAGALKADKEISISVVSLDELPAEFAQLENLGAAYHLEPDGLEFEQPIEVSLQIETLGSLRDQIESGYRSHLIFTQDKEGRLDLLDELTVDISIEDNKVTINGLTNHFSYIVKTEVNLQVTWIMDDAPTLVGQDFSVRLGVKNLDVVHDLVYIDMHYYGDDQVYLDEAISPSFLRIDRLKPGGETWTRVHYLCAQTPGTGKPSTYIMAAIQENLEDGEEKFWPCSVAISDTKQCVAPPEEESNTSSSEDLHTPTITATAPSTLTPTPTNTPTPTVQVSSILDVQPSSDRVRQGDTLALRGSGFTPENKVKEDFVCADGYHFYLDILSTKQGTIFNYVDTNEIPPGMCQVLIIDEATQRSVRSQFRILSKVDY